MTYKQNEYEKQFRAQKNFLFMGLASIIMVFAGFTSAILVRRAAGGWVTYQMPNIFWISTLVIIFSSLLLWLGFQSFKNNKLSATRFYTLLATILGFTFVIMQYIGWQQLQKIGVFINGTPSGSFFYLISWLHALHVVVGLFFIILLLIKSFLKFNKVNIEFSQVTHPSYYKTWVLTSYYWHFVDLLWVYLFIFILIYN